MWSFLKVMVAAILANTVESYDNVNVTVFGMTECPCWGMWQHEFHDLVMSTGVGDIIDLYYYWSGTLDGGGADPDGNITCFHGPVECSGNILVECAKEVSTMSIETPSMYQQWINYTYCIYGPCTEIWTKNNSNSTYWDQFACEYGQFIGRDLDFIIEREKQCAIDFGLDWNEIYECWTNGTGLELTWKSMKHSYDCGVKYGIQGLPVVWINDERFSTFEDCTAYQTKMVPFINKICDVYEGPPPDGCYP